MKNFIVLSIVLLQCLMANSAQSSTIDLEGEDQLKNTVKNYGSMHPETIMPAIDSVIIVTGYNEMEERPIPNTASWYQRSYNWVKGTYKKWSSVRSKNTSMVAIGYNNENRVIHCEDNFKTKRLQFAVKFWDYADHGTEVAICACTSAATAFYILPDPNKCTGEWSYIDFGSIFTGAATLLGVIKIGVKYISSYRVQQLEQTQH